MYFTFISKMYDVAVIGCGVIGLTTALTIQNKLGSTVKVTIFSDEYSPNTTGDIAAGLWTPILCEGTPLDDICRWSKKTQNFIRKSWKQGKAKELGICLMPIIILTDNERYEIPEWTKITLGYSSVSEKQLKTYSKLYNKKFVAGYSFITFTWEASYFLPFFQQEFIRNGGNIVNKHIETFESLSEYHAIVNCTGLNAKKLTNDTETKPIRGQIARVKSPWVFHCFVAESDKFCYIIPNTNCTVLGGTHQEGDYNTDIDENDKNDILSNCKQMMPSLSEAEILKHQVGLRPFRTKVRLEKEYRKSNGNKLLKIVHNYGHGGSGITLCVGCAEDATKLVAELLKTVKNKL